MSTVRRAVRDTAYSPTEDKWVEVVVVESGGYSANAVRFDGSTDYIRKLGGIGGTSNRLLTLSLWANLKGGDTSQHIFVAESNLGFFVYRNTGKQVIVEGYDGAFSLTVSMTSAGLYTTTSGWIHILASSNGTSGHLYINDADDLSGSPTFDSADNIPWGGTGTWAVGATDVGFDKANADMADVWVDDSYLDLSAAANRRKFIDASGKPVDLGSDGSTPTGSSPLMFFSGATASWHTNKGTGGGFSEVGALTNGTDSPSD